MTKQEFISGLRKKLSGLPRQDIEERLSFYNEMIDDRIEEGCTEEEAISDIGTTDEISNQIIRDIPLSKIAKERIKPQKKLSAWEIVLLALGAPIWLSLIIAALAVIYSLYAALWSVTVSVWSVFVSLAACAPAGAIAGIIFAIGGNGLSGICVAASGIICAGLAIIMFFASKAATKSAIILTKKLGVIIKKCLARGDSEA